MFHFFSADDQKMEIIDHTETNLVALRRTIYLTIQSRLGVKNNKYLVQHLTVTVYMYMYIPFFLCKACNHVGLIALLFCLSHI